MRVGAVDYGRRRIGMAICDPLGITVRGLETLTWQGPVEEAARVVAEALEDSGAERVVVGLPLLASGDDSPMSREARRFATALG
ncbi:MAG: Holliday junction resolvase RuvX, partial [Planctomycetota bacterium]